MKDLPSDPAYRKSILKYHPDKKIEVRRKYPIRGSFQSRCHDFSKTPMGNKLRRFSQGWFDLYGSWLEYSVKNAKLFVCFAICLDITLKINVEERNV